MARLYLLKSTPHSARSGTSSTQPLLQFFIGFIKGILADGVVNSAEAKALRSMLEQNMLPISAFGFPLVDLAMRMDALSKDNSWTPENLHELALILESFASDDLNLQPLQPESPAHIIFDSPVPNLVYPGNEFVISGNFAFGPRDVVIDAIRTRGGLTNPNPRHSTRYLIVGSFVSEGWAHGNYGRKIEAAIEIRKTVKNLAIVSEDDWRASL